MLVFFLFIQIFSKVKLINKSNTKSNKIYKTDWHYKQHWSIQLNMMYTLLYMRQHTMYLHMLSLKYFLNKLMNNQNQYNTNNGNHNHWFQRINHTQIWLRQITICFASYNWAKWITFEFLWFNQSK